MWPIPVATTDKQGDYIQTNRPSFEFLKNHCLTCTNIDIVQFIGSTGVPESVRKIFFAENNRNFDEDTVKVRVPILSQRCPTIGSFIADRFR